MDDPHQLCASHRPDTDPVDLVLESGRAVFWAAPGNHEVAAVERSGVLDRYVAVMTHPKLIAETALREAVDSEADELFYGWFDAQGDPVSAEAENAHYAFDVVAYSRSLRAQWRTDGCLVTELRRDDARRGYVSIWVSVRVSLGAVRRWAVEPHPGWRAVPISASSHREARA